jgi:hypothetical protein
MLLAALMILGTRGAAADPCSRADFEAAVGEAAAALRELNLTNKPGFQGKLRQLMAKRGWSHDQLMAEAAPIVQDPTIAAYDERSAAFLAKIERLGAEGTSTATPDCARLAEVRQSMRALVDVQKAKWTYMFGKVEAELKR